MVSKKASLFNCSSCGYSKLTLLQTLFMHSLFHYRCSQVEWQIFFQKYRQPIRFNCPFSHAHFLINYTKESLKYSIIRRFQLFWMHHFGCLWTSNSIFEIVCVFKMYISKKYSFFNASIRFKLNSGIKTIRWSGTKNCYTESFASLQ